MKVAMDGTFIESSIFTRLVPEYLEDGEYAHLQNYLLDAPEAGDLIPGSGGLRKLRYGLRQRRVGKRGGLRVIYYWHKNTNRFFMITLYYKSEVDDLTRNEIRSLRLLVMDWINE